MDGKQSSRAEREREHEPASARARGRRGTAIAKKAMLRPWYARRNVAVSNSRGKEPMDLRVAAPWISDWTPSEHPQITYAYVPADAGEWTSGASPDFEYRDLGLAGASGGKLAAHQIRPRAGGALEAAWQCHDLDFEFFYVLAGWIKLRGADGEVVELHAEDSGCQPPLYWHQLLECSSDCELFRITAPADFATIHDRDAELAERAGTLDPDRRPVYTRDTDDSYVVGDGPRSFFGYRDLGTREPTAGRIHIHAVRVAAPEPVMEGIGWHYHSMAQWFYVLKGSPDWRFESMPRRPLNTGDVVCVGRGPQMRHSVGPPIEPGYRLVEMCVPAAYDTIAVDAPDDAAK